MSVFILPIKYTYISSWGVWEAVREIMQNGLDEQDQLKHELTVSYRDGILSVKNVGASLDAKALLIGHTTKSGTELRGQHGEGLNLAMLSATRADRKMRIETNEEIWTPYIGYSPEYKEKVLHVNIRKRRKPSGCVEVFLEVTQQEWEAFKERFISLLNISEENMIKVYRGTVFLDKEFQGKIFVKGIFVEKDANLKYGYDLKEATLDRDRRVLNTFDKRWEIQNIYSEAVHLSPQKVGKLVFDLLANDWEDARGMTNYSSSSLKEAIAGHFKAEYGVEAVPVQSIGDSAEMGHFGKKGIVVPQSMRGILEKSPVQTPAEVKASFANSIKKSYSYDELEENERDVLSKIEAVFEKVWEGIPREIPALEKFSTDYGFSQKTLLYLPKSVMHKLEIVDFFDKGIQGLCKMDECLIYVSKDVLKNYYLALRVVVHELAHMVDGTSDGHKGHVSTMEELWCLVYAFEHWSY